MAGCAVRWYAGERRAHDEAPVVLVSEVRQQLHELSHGRLLHRYVPHLYAGEEVAREQLLLGLPRMWRVK